MDQEMIEVTKADGSKHIVPKSNLKDYRAYNARYEKHPKFKEELELKWDDEKKKSTSKKQTETK